MFDPDFKSKSMFYNEGWRHAIKHLNYLDIGGKMRYAEMVWYYSQMTYYDENDYSSAEFLKGVLTAVLLFDKTGYVPQFD